ncbi:MAG TPA: SAM-dependent methyltransferase, partial [Thermoplasmatales archaeon]|nr:SAM-dependent methyltransferase [Thermoplasmatales archaeon]
MLLLGRNKSMLLKRGKVHTTSVGKVDLRDVEYGDVVDVGGEKYVLVEPTLADIMKKLRRGAQIVMPKDAAQIVAITGATKGWRCLDAGSGS